MPKLRKKQICKYLPYSLEIINSIGKRIELTIMDFGYHFDKGFNPILRPLTDLLNHDLDYWIDLGEEMGTMHTDSIIESIMKETHYSMDYNRWKKLMNFLLENHFDIDDLIGKGLAFDINTLKS